MAIWADANGVDCQHCNSQLKRVRGCDGGIQAEIEGFPIDRCPVKMRTPQSAVYIRAHGEYQRGFLPNPGGWLQQPMKFSEAIGVVEQYRQKFKPESKHG